jgi:ABC-type branched-subunit amino acid transport system substrate-binding protein
MNFRFLTFAAAVIFIIPAAVFAETPLKVGVIIPLSGPFASFGNAIKSGLKMELDESTSSKIRLIYEDSVYDTKLAMSAYEKLVTEDKVDVLVLMGSPMTAAILPKASQKNIPLFAWTPSKRATEGYRNVMRLMSSADSQGKAIADEMHRRQYKNIAVFSSANEYSQTVRDAFLKNLSPAEVSINEEMDAAEMDFRNLLLRAKTAKAGAIALCVTTPQIAPFAKQARQLGITVPIFGCHMMSAQAILDAAGPELEGAWFIEGSAFEPIEKKLLADTGDTSGLWQAAAHVDLAKLLLQLVDEKAEIKDFLTRAEGRCFKRSGFEMNCVRDENGVKYFDTRLAVTTITNSRFSRGDSASIGAQW